MKFEDFPIEQLAFIVYQDLDIVIVDMLQSDLMPSGIKPLFFTRLRKPLRYLGIGPSPIAGLNFSNYHNYYDKIYKITDELYNKYYNEIMAIFNNNEIRLKCLHIDIIGDGIGESVHLDD